MSLGLLAEGGMLLRRRHTIAGSAMKEGDRWMQRLPTHSRPLRMATFWFDLTFISTIFEFGLVNLEEEE
jgi:hypothetical protein